MDDPEKTQDLAAEPAAEPQQPEVKRPVCPKCGSDPLEVSTCPLQIGRITFWCLMCTACRCPIPVSVVDVAQPQIHQPKGRIAIA